MVVIAGNGVISRIQVAILDEHVVAGADVDSVETAVNGHVFEGDVFQNDTASRDFEKPCLLAGVYGMSLPVNHKNFIADFMAQHLDTMTRLFLGERQQMLTNILTIK